MQDIILLHGAIGSSSQLNSLAQKLSKDFTVHNIDFPGHSGKEMPDAYSIEYFAEYVKNYCEQQNLKSVSIFGYSMGGYVAMYLAKHHPSLVNKIVTLATKFHWDEAIAAKEVKMLQPEIIRQKLPDFATTLEQRHAPLNWEHVLSKTAAMLTGLGQNNTLATKDFADINQPCLIMLGDRDKMVSFEETVLVYKSLPSSQLCILPATPHPIELVNIDMVAFMVNCFIS